MEFGMKTVILSAIMLLASVSAEAFVGSAEGIDRKISAVSAMLKSFSSEMRNQIEEIKDVNTSIVNAANDALTACGGDASGSTDPYEIINAAILTCGGEADKGSTYTLHFTEYYKDDSRPSSGMIVENYKSCKSWAPFNESLADKGDCEVTGDLTYVGKDVTAASVRCKAVCNNKSRCSGAVTTKGTCYRPYEGDQPEGLQKNYTATFKAHYEGATAPTKGVDVKAYKSCRAWAPFNEKATSKGSCDVSGNLSFKKKWTDPKTGAIACTATCRNPDKSGRCPGTVKASIDCQRP